MWFEARRERRAFEKEEGSEGGRGRATFVELPTKPTLLKTDISTESLLCSVGWTSRSSTND